MLNSCLLQPCLSWKYKRNVHCGSQGPWCFQSLPGTLARNCWRGLLQQRTLKTGGQMLSWSIYCLSDWAWWVAGCKKNCGEQFNYVCTSAAPESADGRAQCHHSRIKDDRRPATHRVTGPRSSAIDQPLEFSISLPSDMFPVGSSIRGLARSAASVTAEAWSVSQETPADASARAALTVGAAIPSWNFFWWPRDWINKAVRKRKCLQGTAQVIPLIKSI